MNFQEQIDTIQAAQDGRVVTYISMHDDTVRRAYTDHSFNFVRNTYFIEPLYKKQEVIMVESEERKGSWMPVLFQEMSGDAVRVYFGGRKSSEEYMFCFPNHRKLNPVDKGE